MKRFIALVWIFMSIISSAIAQDVTLAGPPGCNDAALTGTWTVPCNVSSVTVEVYGGGGGAGGGGGGSNGGLFDTRGGGGGGGGGFSTVTINVTPGSSFNYSIGGGGCGGSNGSDASSGGNGAAGGNSSFTGTDGGGSAVNLAANGGARGTGGSGTEGSPGSGGGGGAASGGSTNTNGTAGANGNSGNGGNGGAGAGPGGGAGGAGSGTAGAAYGGGGAGGGNSAGGRGGTGGILITYVTTSPATVTPTITSTPGTCTLAGSSTISNYDATTTYVFTPAGPTVAAGGAINGMVTGTSYTVVAGTGSCASAPSAPFSNAAASGPPAAPTITSAPASCSADGASTISNYNASLTYIFTPAGPTVAAGGAINGMTAGTSYTVEASDGSCNSAASPSFSNAAQFVAPAAPTITSTVPTCTVDGSSTISNYNGALTYTFSPAGPTAAAGGVINGMVTGTNYTVLANDGNCNSTASASFSNSPASGPPATPTVASTPASCTADGISTISNYDATLTYTFAPAGPTAAAGGVVNGMTPGTSYTVEASDGTCNSPVSASFSNATQFVAPAVPTITSTAPTCTVDGSSTISNYDSTLIYIFSPSGPTAAAGGVINSMVTGTSYTLVANDGNCSSAASTAFSNAPAGGPPADPTVVTSPPSCTADGISTISNYNASLTYIFTPTGPTAGAGGVVSGMAIGTSYTVEASDGSCNSGVSPSFSNAAQLPVPTASITGSLTYCVGENTTLTASGGTNYTWTDGGGTNVGNSADVTVTQGTYTVVVANADACTATATAVVVESTSLTVTISGVLSYCEGGNTTLTAIGGTNYVWSDGTATASNTLTQGTYTVTATDGGCSGTATAVVTELGLPAVDLGNDIEACEDSIFVIDAGSGFSSYDWDSGESTQTITPIGSGLYTVTVFNADGCKVTASVNVEFKECIDLNDVTVYIPNAFTPNGDRKNSVFQVFGANITDLRLRVFNRWGEMIYFGIGPDAGWDGTHNLFEMETGIYPYVAEIALPGGETGIYRGSVRLIR